MRNKIIFVFLIVVILATACDKDDKSNLCQMTLTTQKSDVIIGVEGSGKINIDWGDKTAIEVFSLLSGYLNEFTHSYSNSDFYTITITGSYVTTLFCQRQEIYELDVSRNPELTKLYCGINNMNSLDVSQNVALSVLCCHRNQLEEIDVSNNIELGIFICHSNRLSALDVRNSSKLNSLLCEQNLLTSEALNDLFATLHDKSILGETKVVSIGFNSGTGRCDKSIAENKGWRVYSDEGYNIDP